MPTYEYRCAKCGEDLEVFQSFSDEPLKKHAGCGGKLTKVLSSVGIVLKGSGFYKTDNRDSGKGRSRPREDSTASSGTGGSSDSGSESSSSSGDSSTGSRSETSSSDSSKSASTSDKRSSEKKRGDKKTPAKST